MKLSHVYAISLIVIGSALVFSGIYNGRISLEQLNNIYQGELSVKEAFFPAETREKPWTYIEDPSHSHSTGHCSKTHSLLLLLGNELLKLDASSPLESQFELTALPALDPSLSQFYQIGIERDSNKPYWYPVVDEQKCQQNLSDISDSFFSTLKGISKWQFTQFLKYELIRSVDGAISYQRFLFFFDEEDKLTNFAIRTTEEMRDEQRVTINI